MTNDSSNLPDRASAPAPIVAVAHRTRGLPAWGLFVVAALIAGMLSGMLGAVAMFNLLAPTPAGANSGTAGTLASSIRVDESSAVT
ncbi:MAG TPA: hypothetical protein VFM74_02955, partial [Candidatus Limnocylindria bacterium]|nr:hypothetical protein [Candidatus Limnocylindria bacterium]